MKKLICLLCLAMALCVGGCSKEAADEPEPTVEIKTNDVYKAPNKPTSYQVDIYNELTDSVTADKTSKDTAVLVAKNFATDFFTLKNKKDAEDIGGLTYLPKDRREDFKEYASNFYASIEVIKSEHGSKSLPSVKEVVVKEDVEVVEGEVEYNAVVDGTDVGGTFTSYDIPVEIKYNDTKADGLKEEAIITVMNYNGRLCVFGLKNVD